MFVITILRNALFFASLLAALSASVYAQTYPSKPVTLVTPLPAGSTVDSLARVYAQQLSKKLNETVVVENKTGAGLILGMQSVANSPADGHTLAFTPVTPLTIQTHRQTGLNFELESFIPLCQTFENIFYLAVSTKSEIRDAKNLISRLKKEPGNFSYGHSGTGSAPHLMAMEFWKELGIRSSDVPYRGETAFFPDLHSGTLEGGMVTTSAIQQQNFRPLVIFSSKRSETFPDVPTTSELGASVSPSGYGGIFVRNGTPKHVVEKLETMCQEIVESPIYQEKAKSLQQNATFLERVQFSSRLASDHASKGKLLLDLSK